MSTSPTFSDILHTLPDSGHLEAIDLLSHDGGAIVARIANQPGSAGSVRVYHALAKRFGHIDRKAAREGLALYGEHVADARTHPGKHPNVDRLLAIAEADAPGLRMRLVLKP